MDEIIQITPTGHSGKPLRPVRFKTGNCVTLKVRLTTGWKYGDAEEDLKKYQSMRIIESRNRATGDEFILIRKAAKRFMRRLLKQARRQINLDKNDKVSANVKSYISHYAQIAQCRAHMTPIELDIAHQMLASGVYRLRKAEGMPRLSPAKASRVCETVASLGSSANAIKESYKYAPKRTAQVGDKLVAKLADALVKIWRNSENGMGGKDQLVDFYSNILPEIDIVAYVELKGQRRKSGSGGARQVIESWDPIDFGQQRDPILKELPAALKRANVKGKQGEKTAPPSHGSAAPSM